MREFLYEELKCVGMLFLYQHPHRCRAPPSRFADSRWCKDCDTDYIFQVVKLLIAPDSLK